ncbi:MAG: RIP metalloprotease RseP [Spirochaetota bacterium]|nr:RIP metalloprotease RseP [Spirochaetota bacterium]
MFGTDFLMNIFGIVVAVLVLSILVAVHEAGHLLMAKWSGIRVDVFSIGMGKPIWGFQYGETYYQIGRLPFGGFCAFGDEENGNKDDPDPRALMNSPLWARLLTVIGGSLFNIIFAYLVILAMFSIGFKEYHLSNQVAVSQTITLPADNIEIDSPAYKAGLRNGDTIIAIDGKKIEHFIQIPLTLSLSNSATKNILYVRNNRTNNINVVTVADKSTGLDLLGVQPISPAIVSDVLSNSPAEQIGIKAQDQILAINGSSIKFFYQLVDIVRLGQPLSMTVLQNNKTNNITVSPTKIDGVWNLGIRSVYPNKIEVLQKSSNIFTAFEMASDNISSTLSQIGSSLVKLFSGKVNVKENLSGPVRIVSITGDIAKTFDFALLMKFMVMLSLALATFNMLPFPGLDGGALILQTARSIFKKNNRAEKIISGIEQFGIILLLTIAVFVLFNDVKTLVTKKSSVEQIED